MLNMAKQKRQAIIQQLHRNEIYVEEEPKCSFVYNCNRQNAIVRCRTTQAHTQNTPNKCFLYIYLVRSERSMYLCRRYGNLRNKIVQCNKPNQIKGFSLLLSLYRIRQNNRNTIFPQYFMITNISL